MLTQLAKIALAGVALALLAIAAEPVCRADASPITHVIIVVQENRTPDNLFHGLKQYLPDADIADYGYNSKGERIKLEPIPMATVYDPRHWHEDFIAQYDGGKLDGNDLVHCNPRLGKCPPNFGFKYVQPSDNAPYIYIARHWGFANRMFMTQQGPSYPGHQMIFGATSQPSQSSPDFASSNMQVGGNAYAGCSAPADQRVLLIDPTGAQNKSIFPCFERTTLTDLLDAAGLSWRYYTNKPDSIWTAPNSISHICGATSANACTGKEFTKHVIADPPQVLRDIQANKLASVSWVIPDGNYSDHPASKLSNGPSWVSAIINAVGPSPYWQNTVIIVTWDEWGGWYDHVVPPQISGLGYFELGFRVPLLVVSAYTRKGYVSNVQHDFGSIVHFVEKTFGLGFIPPGIFADYRADDLSDFFPRAAPRPFEQPVPAPLPASYFLGSSLSRGKVIDDD